MGSSFGILILLYLFAGGAGSGALAWLAAAEALPSRNLTQSARDRGPLWLVCLTLIAFGMLCLFADLGRPERVLAVFLSPELTPMNVGAYALFAALLCASAFSYRAYFLHAPSRSASTPSPIAPIAVLSVASAVSAFIAMAYTGILLQGMASVLAWQTPFLPLLFVASSLSTGMGAVMLGAAFANGRFRISELALRCARIDSPLIVAELVVLAAFVLSIVQADASGASAQALLSGSLAPRFWACIVGAGLMAPLVLEFLLARDRFVRSGTTRQAMAVIAILLLVGGFCLRWCVVDLNLFDPAQAVAMSQYATMSTL